MKVFLEFWDYFQFILQFSRSVLFISLQPHNCSRPGLLVHHQLLELAETHVPRSGDAIQPSHPLLSPVLFLSHYQGLYQWVSSCIRWPKCWSFSISPSNEDWLVGSPCSPRDSQESCPTPQFKSIFFSAILISLFLLTLVFNWLLLLFSSLLPTVV